jgi:HEAT repeat protein
LGQLREKAPIDALVTLLANQQLPVNTRLAALWALERLGPYAPLQSIVQATRDPSLIVRITAEQILEQMGEYAPTLLAR